MQHMQQKLIIVMVGLPARGKSYITKKVSNYLNWLNINNKIFNVGNKRRLNLIDSTKQNADFFNPQESQNVAIRNQLALSTLDDLLGYITQDDDHNVAIFDATNSTQSRRELIINHVDSYMTGQEFTKEEYSICFLESICNDLDIIENNIKLKLNGPDYKNIDQHEALLDFKKRVLNYESIYESVSSTELNKSHLQYLKIINIHNIQQWNIQGIYSILLTNFLQHYNVNKKSIWLSINNLDFNQVSPQLISKNNLTIMSEDDSILKNSQHQITHKRIPKLHTLDQIHDLILDLESFSNDLLIQTQDQFLINGLFKYFKILQYSKDHCSKIDLSTEIICINPSPYQVDLTKIDLSTIYPNYKNFLPALELSRSNNSSMSSCLGSSNLLTPNWDFDEITQDFKEIDMKNLNQELEKRLGNIIL